MLKNGLIKLPILILLMAITSIIKAQIADSLDIKIGQMILIGVPSTVVDPKVLDEIKKGKAGAIIFFEKNIPRSHSYENFKKVIWTYQDAAPIPLFVSIDQEGGKVNRLKEKYGFPRSITAQEMGKDGALDSVRFYGETTAATLAGLGINVNFAPDVDLGVDPNNPVIYKAGRAFSADPDSVALFASEWIKTHRKMGIITTPKHFPGHGSSKDDTHIGLADVTNTWTEKELKPYKLLIQSGMVDAVMTSHIVNKRLDPEGNPGTLSKPILDGILRKKLGWNGVVFSDDMQMQAITKHYGLEETIKKAINAGVDVMTFSNNIASSEERTVDKVHKIIKDLVLKGEIDKKRIDLSYRRIMNLKNRLTTQAEDVFAQENAAQKIELRKMNDELAIMKQEIDQLKEKNDELSDQLKTSRDTKKKKRKK